MRGRLIVAVLALGAVVVARDSGGKGQQAPSSRGGPERSDYVRLGAFEIQAFAFNRGPWFEAAQLCLLRENARLCTPSEWMTACRSGVFRSGSNTPEWVEQLAPETDGIKGSGEGLRALAFVGCERPLWLNAYKDFLQVRCCRTRTDSLFR